VVRDDGSKEEQNMILKDCDSTDLLMWEHQRAMGPLPDEPAIPEDPPCRVTPESLSALQAFHDAEEASKQSTQLVHPKVSDSNSQLQTNATGPYFLQLSVFKVPASWCAPPCHGPSWENSAEKPVRGDKNYGLLEATIWDAENRVALYEFDAEWHKKTKAVPQTLCDNKWRCQAYKDHREKAKIWEAQIPPGIKDKQKSLWMASKWKEIFAIVLKRNPQHWGMTYSGHGARASGALFEGVVFKEDAQVLLSEASKVKKATFLNFGGNCAEGKWNMVQALHPFADYIFASDLLVYGVAGVPKAKFGEYIKLKKEMHDLNHIKVLMEKRMGMEKAARTLLDGWSKIWTFVKDEIAKIKLKQSKSLYKSSAFEPFKDALKKKWMTLYPDKRHNIMGQVEKAMCDTGVFAKLVAGDDAYKLYQEFRIKYVDTSDFFKWDVPTKGLGFNFLGYKQPPCDVSSFGEGGKQKNCKVQGTAFAANGASPGCENYKQGEKYHDSCGVHVDARTGNKVQDVCRECGVCMPAPAACKGQLWQGQPRPFVGPNGDCTHYGRKPRDCRDPKHKDMWSKDPVTLVCPQCGMCLEGGLKGGLEGGEEKKTEQEKTAPVQEKKIAPVPQEETAPVQEKKTAPVQKKKVAPAVVPAVDDEKPMTPEEIKKMEDELQKQMNGGGSSPSSPTPAPTKRPPKKGGLKKKKGKGGKKNSTSGSFRRRNRRRRRRRRRSAGKGGTFKDGASETRRRRRRRRTKSAML